MRIHYVTLLIFFITGAFGILLYNLNLVVLVFLKVVMKNFTKDLDKHFYKRSSSLEKIRHLLSYALLAPSTHNTQPWLFKIKKFSCEIYRDRRYSLPEADPEGGNMLISIGACIENLVLAASYYDVYKEIQYSGHKDSDLIAEVIFQDLDKIKSPNLKYKQLLNAIPKRFSYRGPFTNESVKCGLLEEICSDYDNWNVNVHRLSSSEQISYISSLTYSSIKKIADKKKFRGELSHWMRTNYSHKKDGIPGYAYGFSNVLSFVAPTLMTLMNLSVIMAKKTKQSIDSANSVFVFTVPDSDQMTIINLGRVVERYLLAITALGMKTNIAIAAIQDESSQHDLQSYLKTEESPKFLFVSGYQNTVKYNTPRHKLDDKLKI